MFINPTDIADKANYEGIVIAYLEHIKQVYLWLHMLLLSYML